MDENIEDAWLFKKEAAERGLGMSSVTNIITSSLGKGEEFQYPAECAGTASHDKYHAIASNGLPRVGAWLKGGDAVTGKVFSRKAAGVTMRRCVSKFMPYNFGGRVSSVSTFPNDGVSPVQIVRVSVTKNNAPEAGNKYYIAHGQKATAGRFVPSVDLPFICSGPNAGLIPTCVINVCSLSRVTQGLLAELGMAKARALRPDLVEQYDNVFMGANSFADKMQLCCHILKMAGMRDDGKEMMCSGTTGRVMKSRMMSGMVYLHVLKHMSADKLRARDRGPTNELTRQTSVGKKNFGGQKVGEMENWNLHCYGAPHMFQNINYESADKFNVFYCQRCHVQALGCVETGYYMCLSCKSADHLVEVRIPYITNLTFQELYTAGIGHTIVTRPIGGKGE
jgi:DNA-directed RNA polymerase beta subunit